MSDSAPPPKRKACAACTSPTLASRCATNQDQSWDLVADTQSSQSQIIALKAALQDRAALRQMIHQDVELGNRALARLVAGSDGLQASGEEAVTVHHYANVLFNIMRGGTFIDHGLITKTDFLKSVEIFNRALRPQAEQALQDLPAQFQRRALMAVHQSKAVTATRAACPRIFTHKLRTTTW